MAPTDEWRIAHFTSALASRGARSSIVRLPPARHLGVPAVSVSPARAHEYVGFLGGFWGFDGPASAQLTRDLLDWQPIRLGLIADLREGHYFD